MRKTVVWLVGVVALVVICVLGTVLWMKMPPKVGVVRVNEVLEKFDGAIEARKDFQRTTTAWQSNIDTLRAELQRSILDLERDAGQLSDAQRKAREMEISQKRSEIDQYTGAVQEKASREQALLTEGVVNQIRTAAETVANSQGFDLVHALQTDGAILYHTDLVDITPDVLEYLRANYRTLSNSATGKAK